MAKVIKLDVKTPKDAWRHLMSAVAERAVLDWLQYRDCDIKDREKVRLRDDALTFIRGERFGMILGVIAPNVSRRDVLEALDIREDTEEWEKK